MDDLSDVSKIKDRIYIIRGVQVMLDSDIAELYGVETKVLNQAVKRNLLRFPERYCFRLLKEEVPCSRSQIVTLNDNSGRGSNIKYLPHVFTQEGIAMLSAVLKSRVAVQVSINIMDAFVAMRHYLEENAVVFQRLDRIEIKQLESDEKINYLFKQLEAPKENKAVIFFKGQMWDAVSCIEEIIGKAKESIILIDNYVDKGTLDMLSKKTTRVLVEIYTIKKNCNLTEKEIYAFKKQYGQLVIKYTDEFHDRFLILDRKALYHIGASIKDAGKKAFEINVNEDEKSLIDLLKRL